MTLEPVFLARRLTGLVGRVNLSSSGSTSSGFLEPEFEDRSGAAMTSEMEVRRAGW